MGGILYDIYLDIVLHLRYLIRLVEVHFHPHPVAVTVNEADRDRVFRIEETVRAGKGFESKAGLPEHFDEGAFCCTGPAVDLVHIVNDVGFHLRGVLLLLIRMEMGLKPT